MSELEKIVIALAIGIFVFVLSDNVGRLVYGPIMFTDKEGYKIPVEERQAIERKTGLPDVLDMISIMKQANAQAGEAVFRKVCTLCHNGDKGGPNKVGPNLWGIFNNHAAHKEDFSYSKAMVARKETGVLWNTEELYRYIYAPKQYVPGTKMSFVGIKDDTERADLIAYLETLQ